MVFCSLQVDSFPAFSGTPVTDIPFRPRLGLNQPTYERLKIALSLDLRRQIFIAVCDDLPLRDRLAMQLQSELALAETVSASGKHPATRAIPRLVTLDLNLDDPNPIAQMVEWLSYFPSSSTGGRPGIPAFQFLGIERLTRQPAELQSMFLAYLQNIEQTMPAIESGLLLWMTLPWFRMLPEAVPDFWDCRTAVFEFIGDPTPLPTSSPERIRLHSSNATSSSIGFFSSSPLPAPPDSETDSETDSDLNSGSSSSTTGNSTNPWLPLAAKLNTWYEPESGESSISTPCLSALSSLIEGQWDEQWLATFNQLLTQDLKTDRSGVILQSLHPSTETQPADAPQFDSPISVVVQPASDSVTQPSDTDANTEFDTETHQPSAPNAALNSLELSPHLPDHDPSGSNFATVAEQNHGGGDQPVPLLQHIERLQEQITLLEQGQASTAGLAIAYQTLGNFYRDCIEQGEASAENLTSAIQAYEQALQWLPEKAPEQAETLNELGNLYWMIAQYQADPGEAVLCLQQTEQIYQQALTHLTLPQQSQTYAMVQNNLAAIYADLARYQDPAANLQRSVVAYQQALEYRTADVDSLRYASTQNNLGTTYWNLAQQQQPQLNLKQAIAAYSAALEHYDPALDPLTHAMIQNNLGTAYWNLAQYEEPQDNLRLALKAYQSALQYRTLETVPVSFAATQNNLGTALWHLANHVASEPERLTYLQHAIIAYDSTLAAAAYLKTQHAEAAELNFDLFSTHNNLGLAHHQLATERYARLNVEQQTRHLTLALQHHLAALQGWEPNPHLRQTALNCVVQAMRAFYTQLGLPGQNQALAHIPGHVLPEILPKLGFG